MNDQQHITRQTDKHSVQEMQSVITYVGYVNGKLTRFFLKMLPGNRFVKVEATW
ncbi:MAG: hypothetical protein IAE67_06440 [Candidatus Competibacteraceae bacterium]|nr:hypothetical protein [Candidatus Competibacteraceae bacterium]